VPLAAALALALTPGAQAAQPVHVSCGDTITKDTKLANDLTNCPGDGIVIGADDITLDLNGHTVDGDRAGDDSEDFGIDNTSGHDGVTIKGGSIRDFVEGVEIHGASDNIVRDLATSHHWHSGIFVFESTDFRIEKNSVLSNIVGMVIAESSHVRVEHNIVSGSEFAGIAVLGSDHMLVAKNSATGSGEAGIVLVGSDNSRVERNRSNGNLFGVYLESSDHNRVERNTASGNVFAGIAVYADDNAVNRNRVFKNAEGIDVFGSRNAITDNQVADTVGCPDCFGFGILLAGGKDNVIARNDVRRTLGEGILMAALDPDTPTVDNVVGDNHVHDATTDGISVGTEGEGTLSGTLIKNNVAVGSGDDGIDVDSPATTLTRNTANRNHDLGIEAVPGVTDGGGNKASGNGNPLQCTNVFCK
jgi:parallel beta-helix repeat protein